MPRSSLSYDLISDSALGSLGALGARLKEARLKTAGHTLYSCSLSLTRKKGEAFAQFPGAKVRVCAASTSIEITSAL